MRFLQPLASLATAAKFQYTVYRQGEQVLEILIAVNCTSFTTKGSQDATRRTQSGDSGFIPSGDRMLEDFSAPKIVTELKVAALTSDASPLMV